MWEGASYSHEASEMNHGENSFENQRLQESRMSRMGLMKAHSAVSSCLTLGLALYLVSENARRHLMSKVG